MLKVSCYNISSSYVSLINRLFKIELKLYQNIKFNFTFINLRNDIILKLE